MLLGCGCKWDWAATDVRDGYQVKRTMTAVRNTKTVHTETPFWRERWGHSSVLTPLAFPNFFENHRLTTQSVKTFVSVCLYDFMYGKIQQCAAGALFCPKKLAVSERKYAVEENWQSSSTLAQVVARPMEKQWPYRKPDYEFGYLPWSEQISLNLIETFAQEDELLSSFWVL